MMLGSPCSPCCGGCDIEATMYAIAAKSCVVNLSGYIPKHEAATYVYAAGIESQSRGSTAIAYPTVYSFSEYNPTDSQLAQLLFNPATPFAAQTNAMTVQAFAETAVSPSTGLALEKVGIHPGGPIDNLIGSANRGAGVVSFVAIMPGSLVRVTVVIDRSPISVPVQLEGSKCYFAASVAATAERFYETKTYAFGPLNGDLLPSDMAADIDPQADFRISIDDDAPIGGKYRAGVVRVVSPYYTSAFVNPLNSINCPAASVFSADVRASKALTYGTGGFASVGAGTTTAVVASRLSISGTLDGVLQLSASAIAAAGGNRWFPYTPAQPQFPEWGVNPTYRPPSTIYDPPTVHFQASSNQYGEAPAPQGTTIEAWLS